MDRFQALKRSSPLPKSHPQFGMSTAHESLVPSGPDRVQVASAPRRLRLARIWPGSRNRQAAPGSGTALAGPFSAGWNSPRTVGLRCARSSAGAACRWSWPAGTSGGSRKSAGVCCASRLVAATWGARLHPPPLGRLAKIPRR